jgi:hypothetical protein
VPYLTGHGRFDSRTGLGIAVRRPDSYEDGHLLLIMERCAECYPECGLSSGLRANNAPGGILMNYSRATGAAVAWLLLFVLIIGGSIHHRLHTATLTDVAKAK